MRISQYMKEVSEDWYSNFKIADDKRYEYVKFIAVSFIHLSNGDYRVCAWGNDDFGYDYDTKDELEARALFQEIALLHKPTQYWFETKGFERA